MTAASPTLPATAPALGVSSEIAPLRQVLVHTPGEEMALVSPENKLALLFDDILFADRAEEEHRAMCRLFRRAVGADDAVLQVATLLRETFEDEDARHAFVERMLRAMPTRNLAASADDLRRLAPEELHRFALTGQSPLPLTANPVPNLMFTRDLCAFVGDHLVLSHAATAARARESVIMSTLVRHHPRFAALEGRVIEIPMETSFEGGDLLVVDDKTVLIGHSERTSLGGVMALVKELLERTTVEHVLMVNLPKERYCMHLDTVFTFASETECVAFPPVIMEERHNVFHYSAGDRPGRYHVEVWPSLQGALEALTGRALTFIACGGEDPLAQRREQWTDGANLFAIAPGFVVGYERNQRTFEAMRQHGYHVVDTESFLAYYGASGELPRQKVAVMLRGHELSRGRGGPRCMTMPLARVGADA